MKGLVTSVKLMTQEISSSLTLLNIYIMNICFKSGQ